VTDVNPAAGDSFPQGLTAVGNELFFFAHDGVTGGNKLYKTNGTPGNWTLVKDIVPNNDDYGGSDGIGATAGRLFFSTGELWTSDGTPDGTYRVTDAAGASPTHPSYFIPLNETEVVFEGNSRLWKSDGTPGGTMELANIDPEHSGTSWRTHFARLGNAVYLTADRRPNSPQGIWRTDGTPQGTYMVSNMNPGGTGYTGQLAAVNGSLMFTTDDGVRGLELWRYVPDAPPLLVTEAQFDPGAAAPATHRLTFRLSAAAAALPQPGELSLLNLTTNAPVPADSFVRSYDSAAQTVTFTFPGFAGGALPDGNYRALLPAGALADTAGNALGLDHTFEFFVLHGDINRDRAVNGTDFAILAGNFGKAGMTYAQGDLNGDGAVNGSDFAILAGNFGKTVPPVQSMKASAAVPPSTVQARASNSGSAAADGRRLPPAARRRVSPPSHVVRRQSRLR
jgi:ELWxxDGT repeat protein